MSSHREAPEVSKDPVADSTDVYAFVSPDKPDTVTLIANFIPLQKPDGGPNFYEFGDDVRYEIKIDNDGDGKEDVTYQFEFKTRVRNPESFLYNTGQIKEIRSPNWNRPQYYDVFTVRNGKRRKIASNLPCPPCNVGARSLPDYSAVAQGGYHKINGGRQVFAGQRADAFHVDLGSIFDLGALRPFGGAHLISMPDMSPRNATQTFNVHSIAIQIPITQLTKNRSRPKNVEDRNAVIGVWATSSRKKSRMWDRNRGQYVGRGPWVQVNRLGNPLFNEVVTPMGLKDNWNGRQPRFDRKFEKYVYRPELGKLLPFLYPGVFPNLEAYNKDRADLHAILMTGIPSGIVPGFQNYTGPRPMDVLRLNVAVPPKQPEDQSEFGILGGDLAGFPNGRRLGDDVTAIELRAIAGATIPLVDPSYTPDDAAGALTDGTSYTDSPFLGSFPYMGLPSSGLEIIPPTKNPEESN
ncbi:DUF4331 domain-containing protein [Nocardioides salsibiostraticola]